MKRDSNPARRSCGGLLLVCILLFAACGRATGPKGLSGSTYAAARKAIAALESASESRNANSSVFDPKFQTAAQAADEVFNEMGEQSSDGYAVSQLKSCVNDLKAYRSNFESRETATRPIQDQLKGLKGAEIKDSNDVMATASRELDECLKQAKGYL